MFRSAAIMLALCFITLSAQAALIGRVALTPGGTDYQAYYDDVLDITWLADADYAATNTFGVTGYGIGLYGVSMQWSTALAWTVGMNNANHLGVNNWRLPSVTDTGSPGCTGFDYNGTDCGWNVDLSTGEMAHLFYSTLGMNGSFDTNGQPTGCDSSPPTCLTNTDPFTHLRPEFFWSGNENVAYTPYAWGFNFGTGGQGQGDKTAFYRVWAVRDGDIAIVPVPASVWLFGSALGLMGRLRRKAAA
jgi:hypothetical protein